MIHHAHVDEASTVVRRGWGRTARMGLILGTGLNRLEASIEADLIVPYENLPHFPRSTAPGHAGRLVCGSLQGCPIVAMSGRCHSYEGYSHDEIVFPVRVMREVGAETLVISNACGGLNPRFATGDVMVVADHIDLMLRGPSAGESRLAQDQLVRRSAPPYDPTLIAAALEIARREDFMAHLGVYLAVTGPNYETRAECRFLRSIGADAVGMSTVPEVAAAVSCGMRTLALSVVTNVVTPDAPRQVEANEVVAAASRAAANLGKIVSQLAARQAPPA